MVGAVGRMGQSIIELSNRYTTSDNKTFLLTGAFDHATNKNFINRNNQSIETSKNLEDSLQGADIIIDFSSPESSLRVSEYCIKNKIPLVVGTTGFTGIEKEKMYEASKTIAMILSPNMSIGVNLLFEITKLAASILENGYDVEVVEAHHHFKKDSPSGTAMKLKEVLLNTMNRNESDVIYGRKGMVGERKPKEIGMHTIRGGDVVGDHTVHFFGDGERIELTHRASSRVTFATGALKAAAYLLKQSPGIYTLKDVLGLNSVTNQ